MKLFILNSTKEPKMAFRATKLELGKYGAQEMSPGVGVWRYEKKLPLTTPDHKLRLMAWGTGAAFSNRLSQSNFVIVKGNTALFVDLGSKTSHKMAEFGVSVHEVKHLIITHSHADHYGGLEELALKRRYEAPYLEEPPWFPHETREVYLERIIAARNSGKFRPNLYIPNEYAEVLWDASLRGGLAFSEEVDQRGRPGEMGLGQFFNLLPPTAVEGYAVSTWEQTIGGIKVRTFRTKHVPDTTDSVDESMYSVGLVIDDRVYISGDTRFDADTTISFGASCELLLHDVQHFPGGVHAYYDELVTGLPPEVRAKTMLYHLTDSMIGKDIKSDGFLGFLQATPVVYDFD